MISEMSHAGAAAILEKESSDDSDAGDPEPERLNDLVDHDSDNESSRLRASLALHKTTISLPRCPPGRNDSKSNRRINAAVINDKRKVKGHREPYRK